MRRFPQCPRWLLLGAGWLGFTASGFGQASSSKLPTVSYEGQSYVVHSVDPKKEDLRLFWKDDKGNLLQDFEGVKKELAAKGEQLVFGANAGMFEPDSKPVGLLVQDGVEQVPINLNDAPGNFYLKPNGVFLINEKHEAKVIDSTLYAGQLLPTSWATQSGPLLVFGGNIHPEFNADSKSRKYRSGVGVRKDGIVVFALSENPVTFYEFASLFLEKLQCPNALFLDGDISAFYFPDIKDPKPHTFGPMVGVVEKIPDGKK